MSAHLSSVKPRKTATRILLNPNTQGRQKEIFVYKELLSGTFGKYFLRINKGCVYRAQLFGTWFLAGFQLHRMNFRKTHSMNFRKSQSPKSRS